MKYIFIASLISSAVYAAPFAQQGRGGNGQTGQQQQGNRGGQKGGANTPATGPQTGTGAGVANGQTPSSADLATAVANWMADTSMVSDFLNRGAGIQNNVAFKQAATVAFNAEVDELNHKAIIDAANGADPNVIAANSTLATGGSFQDVVDKLQLMSTQGLAAVGNIELINQNRCVNVLPNIDAYFASTGSASQAVRPTVCDQTGVAGGVQGTGTTQPGQPAGSPAAAFAAAQALTAGTGNGLVQNGVAPQAQQQAGQGQQAVQGQQQAGQGQQQAGQGQQAAQGQQQQAGVAPVQGQAPTQAQTPTQQGTGAQGQAASQRGQQAAGSTTGSNQASSQAPSQQQQQQKGQVASATQGQVAQAPKSQADGAAGGQRAGAAAVATQ